MAHDLVDETLLHEQGDPARGHPLYPGFNQSSTILKKGTVVLAGALALPCDILKEQDISVKLRDDTIIYIDVLRPPHKKYKLPAIISWGPFGKNGGLTRKIMSEMPWRVGIPQHTVSGLENFEALDPAYWCSHGYALVHPDIRGAWRSQGNARINSDQEGRDGYDLVEWIAEQPWCNKRVTMAGSSWLSQSQWFIGAQCPPHLTCLCPYEGWSDMYNDNTNRGGIPDPGFQQFLLNKCYPTMGKTEDVANSVLTNPLWTDYYERRKAQVEKISVPMYIVASWTNFLHSRGTFRGYLESSSCRKKWLRVHNNHEWPVFLLTALDLYYPQNVEDCRKFLDHYMKDVSNGWEFTPPVRLSILNFGHKDIVNRPELEFPLSRQESVKMSLDAHSSALLRAAPVLEPGVRIFSATNEIAYFRYIFTQRTELTGFFALTLFVSSPSNAKDIDLFVSISKLSSAGSRIQTATIDVGYLADDPDAERESCLERQNAGDPSVGFFFADGPHGRLRVSHRELDTGLSKPHWPRYTHRIQQLLSPDEIVEVCIELWPYGMIFEQGEKLNLEIAGYNFRSEGLPMIPPCPTLNQKDDKIAIHTGGEHHSFLLVPQIPDRSH